jgi:hypothetical protein
MRWIDLKEYNNSTIKITFKPKLPKQEMNDIEPNLQNQDQELRRRQQDLKRYEEKIK